jgi:hypothetical protein
MKYAVEMGSGVMIYSHLSSFTKTGFGHSKFDRGRSGVHTEDMDIV